MNELLVANNPNRIINSKAASTTTREIQIPMGGSSSGDMVYKCGPHDFETRNLKEFNYHLNTTHNESKAASLPKEPEPEPEKPIIEGIPHYTVNKVKEIHDFMVSNGSIPNSDLSPKRWKEERHANGSVVYTNPNTASKAASGSVSGINKVKAIHDFLTSNGRL